MLPEIRPGKPQGSVRSHPCWTASGLTHAPAYPCYDASSREGTRVQHLIGFCHDDACRHQALIDVSDCPDHVEVRWFQQRAKCSKCGGKRVDVRPNWKEAPGMPDMTTAAGS